MAVSPQHFLQKPFVVFFGLSVIVDKVHGFSVIMIAYLNLSLNFICYIPPVDSPSELY